MRRAGEGFRKDDVGRAVGRRGHGARALRVVTDGMERVFGEQRDGLVDEDGGDDFRAGLADGFFHFAKVALEGLKLRFADGNLGGAQEAFLGRTERGEREKFVEETERAAFVRALGGVDGALLRGLGLELGVEVREGGVDVIVMGVVERDAFFRDFRAEVEMVRGATI